MPSCVDLAAEGYWGPSCQGQTFNLLSALRWGVVLCHRLVVLASCVMNILWTANKMTPLLFFDLYTIVLNNLYTNSRLFVCLFVYIIFGKDQFGTAEIQILGLWDYRVASWVGTELANSPQPLTPSPLGSVYKTGLSGFALHLKPPTRLLCVVCEGKGTQEKGCLAVFSVCDAGVLQNLIDTSRSL